VQFVTSDDLAQLKMELDERYGIDEIRQNISSFSAFAFEFKNFMQQQVTF